MKLLEIYKCLGDETRLRILHLLAHQRLCVCHFQEILGESQVKISKHLAYLREHGMVDAERCGAWVVYSIASGQSEALRANLRCLRSCGGTEPVYAADLGRMPKVMSKRTSPLDSCGPKSRPKTPAKSAHRSKASAGRSRAKS